MTKLNELPLTKANSRQIGGEHYKTGGIEHWDIVHKFNLDYFQGQITKYVMRWKAKGGLDDLKKAQHFLEKYIELESPESLNAEVKPSGWEGFVFEGGTKERFIFTCSACRHEVITPPNCNPNVYHRCPSQPGPGYVDQG